MSFHCSCIRKHVGSLHMYMHMHMCRTRVYICVHPWPVWVRVCSLCQKLSDVLIQMHHGTIQTQTLSYHHGTIQMEKLAYLDLYVPSVFVGQKAHIYMNFSCLDFLVCIDGVNSCVCVWRFCARWCWSIPTFYIGPWICPVQVPWTQPTQEAQFKNNQPVMVYLCKGCTMKECHRMYVKLRK